MKYLKLFNLLFIYFFITHTTHAASVLPLNLNELLQGAQHVFVGTCITNNTVMDSTTQMMSTFTSFQVNDLLKGELSNTHTIKQIAQRVSTNKITMLFPSVPTFIVGQQYVVFIPQSSKLGYSSPVGLQQGSFDIIQEGQQAMVTNGRSFGDLLSSSHQPDDKDSIRRNKQFSRLTFNPNVDQTKIPLANFIEVVKSMEGKQ